MRAKDRGYVLIMLLFVVTAMGIGLMVAVPVWQTQIRREKEEELIFRGRQYVEAIRLFQLKRPGAFPRTLQELVDEKCLRRLYQDPMSPDGDWNIILLPEPSGQAFPGRRRLEAGPDRELAPGEKGGQVFSAQTILVAPQRAVGSIRNPQIIGVVSSSGQKSFRIYNDQESYDRWLFFYGQDPKQLPEIIYYGQPTK